MLSKSIANQSDSKKRSDELIDQIANMDNEHPALPVLREALEKALDKELTASLAPVVIDKLDSNEVAIDNAVKETTSYSINHSEIADWIANNYSKFQRTKHSAVYSYDSERGIWRCRDENYFIAEIEKDIRNMYAGDNLKNSTINDINAIVKRRLLADEDAFTKSDPNVIVCSNVELHLNETEGTWEEKPHNPEAFRVQAINTEFDSNATCPVFEKYLQTTFGNLKDSDNTILRILELIGMTLIASSKEAQIMFLDGLGRNGKGVLLDVIQFLVGMDNSTTVKPHKLEHHNDLADLHGKLFARCGDISKGKRLEDGPLKDISAGDTIAGRHPYGQTFTFEPTCTFWFAGNNGLASNDTSDGMLDRLNIIPFRNKVEAEDRDENIFEKLRAERSGILNMVLKAYGEKRKRKSFTKSLDMDEVKSAWFETNNLFKRFAKEKVEYADGVKSTHTEVFSAFRTWCIDNEGIEGKLPNRTTVRMELSKIAAAGGAYCTDSHANTWWWHNMHIVDFSVVEDTSLNLVEVDTSATQMF